jgi:hypothetical protein
MGGKYLLAYSVESWPILDTGMIHGENMIFGYQDGSKKRKE